MPAGVDVRRELFMVAKLHSIDGKLQELEQEKGDLPMMVRRLETNIQEHEKELEKLKSKAAELSKERRAFDGQIQLARVKQDKYKEQLYAVTTNREYDAITNEIETIDGQVKAFEESQLSLLEEEESLLSKAESVEKALEEMRADMEERGSELDEKESETEAEELELVHEREKLLVRIKKPIIAHYDRIRQARNGVGATHLYAAACGACFAVVPPQRQAEIRKMNDIILCEQCGVILLPEEEHFEGMEDD